MTEYLKCGLLSENQNRGHDVSAANGKIDSSDERREVRGEERDGMGDFRVLAPPLEGNGFLVCLILFSSVAPVAFADGPAGAT